ncbi:MAG: hypothetical protein QOF11_255 [Chloroflexota bacterium]|nr:hypothetical protein [Chloroflexota bacterium]
MSVDALLDEVRRRRTPEQPLHVTAIVVLAEAALDRAAEDQLALARAGWSAVRAEGATDTFPSLSYSTLELVRTGVELSDDAFLALPDDDQVNVVLMGFLNLVGERLADEEPAEPTPAKPATASQTAKPAQATKPAKAVKPAQAAKPAKPRARRSKSSPRA